MTSAPEYPEPDLPAEEPLERRPLWSALRAAPPWLVSTVFHAVGLVVLALMTIAVQPPDDPRGSLIVATETEEDEALQELADVEIQPQELPEIENVSVSVAELDPGLVNFSDLTSLTEMAPAADVGDLALPETTIGEIGALFGKDGKGMSDISDGLAAAATFFGAKSTGSRFVFVVDNSNSMGGGKFETTLDELVRSVEAMRPPQRFYVIFFSDTAYRMFHPQPAEGMILATPENKTKLRSWLYTVEMCLRTKGEQAVKAAIAMRPDAIYILGDGAFTDKTGQLLTAPHNRRVTIHTIGMQVNQRGEQELTGIAKANHGTFRNVEASPAARQAARQNPIPRHRTRGKVWGITLPVEGRKKKK